MYILKSLYGRAKVVHRKCIVYMFPDSVIFAVYAVYNPREYGSSKK